MFDLLIKNCFHSFLCIFIGSSTLLSQDFIDCSNSTHEIKIYLNPVSFERAEEHGRSLGEGWKITSPTKINLYVNLCKSKITRNTFWTSKEVYLSSDNVKSDKTYGGYYVDYDGTEVYYIDQNSINPEKQSNLHSVIFVKEKVTDLQTVKNSLSKAVQVGQMKVYPIPFSSESFTIAQAMCKNLGEGWRLPTLEELKQIKASGAYNDPNALEGNFFWSSSKTCDGCFDSYYAYSFINGNQVSSDIRTYYRYFAVQTPTTASDLKTWNFGSYEVNLKMFGPMTIEEANSLCLKMSDLSNQWKVTNMQQLSSIIAYKSDKPEIIGKRLFSYENRNQMLNISDLKIVKIEPLGTSEIWGSGSAESRCYFFMCRIK
jgi:hypothetical protein